MANEIFRDFPSGSNLYSAVRRSGGDVWYIVGESFEAWGNGGHDASDYATVLVDRKGSHYEGDFPSGIPAGRYTVQIFLRSGIAPADTDTTLGEDDFRWSGSGQIGGGDPVGGGEISAPGVLTFVNTALLRSEASIDTELQTVLDDLSQGTFLEGVDTSQSLVDGDEFLGRPDNYYSMISIVLNDGTQDLQPLKPFPGGYKAYRDQRGDTASVFTSMPIYFVIKGDVIWLYPIPGRPYTSRIDYYKLHDQDVDNIEFSNEWRRAVNFGTAFEVALKYKLPDQIPIWGPRYENEKEMQRVSHPGEPRIIGA